MREFDLTVALSQNCATFAATIGGIRMTESLARLVDSLCKIVATIALVVGGGWTLYTYFNARAAEARTATIEARKPFLSKMLEVYSSLVELSGKMIGDYTFGDSSNPRTQEQFQVMLDDHARLVVFENGPLALVGLALSG